MNTPPAATPTEPDPARQTEPLPALAPRLHRRRDRSDWRLAARRPDALRRLGLPRSSRGPRPASGPSRPAPRLPAGFTRTFKSRFVTPTGSGSTWSSAATAPPLLLVHGWPENWYAWRFVMPALARKYTVIAVDQRGIGLTEQDRRRVRRRHPRQRPGGAHDRARPRTVRRRRPRHRVRHQLRAGRRPPRSGRPAGPRRDPRPPGSTGRPRRAPPPPMFVPEAVNNKLWHIPFNRVNDELIIDMVRSNANAYYRYEYAIQGGGAGAAGLRHRVLHQALHPRPEHPASQLRPLPRLGRPPGTEHGAPEGAADHPGPRHRRREQLGRRRRTTASRPPHQACRPPSPGAGHWVAEQNPPGLLAALSSFLAPYRAAA